MTESALSRRYHSCTFDKESELEVEKEENKTLYPGYCSLWVKNIDIKKNRKNYLERIRLFSKI